MMEYEEILNSGKIYNVWTLTSDNTDYLKRLRLMEKYNAAGYTKRGEKKK